MIKLDEAQEIEELLEVNGLEYVRIHEQKLTSESWLHEVFIKGIFITGIKK